MTNVVRRTASDAADRWHEVELHDAETPPPDGWHWLAATRLADQHWADPRHGPLVRQCLAERDEGEPVADGRDWERAGWWDVAAAWTAERLASLGAAGPLSIEQIRCWEFSCVARVQTARGTWHFKVLPTTYAHEPLLTQQLALERMVPMFVRIAPARGC